MVQYVFSASIIIYACVSRNMSPEFPNDYGMTVERLENLFEGRQFESDSINDTEFKCDFCSDIVSYDSEPHVGHYMADKVIFAVSERGRYVNDERMLTQLGTYCSDCSTQKLLFPCEGYTEVRLFFTIGKDGRIKNPDVSDISPEDDGIPWNPKELTEKITGIGGELNAQLAGEDLWGPENIVTFFFVVCNMDIRELIDWKGNIDPQKLGEVRKQYQQFMTEMKRGGFSEDEFTNKFK